MLFPEPDWPTMPMIWPAGTLKLTSCKISGAVDTIAKRDVIKGDIASDREEVRRDRD